MTERCENCRFFDTREHYESPSGNGYCRRHSPTIVVEIDTEEMLWAQWPVVIKEDWCGEFQPKAVGPEKYRVAGSRLAAWWRRGEVSKRGFIK